MKKLFFSFLFSFFGLMSLVVAADNDASSLEENFICAWESFEDVEKEKFSDQEAYPNPKLIMLFIEFNSANGSVYNQFQVGTLTVPQLSGAEKDKLEEDLRVLESLMDEMTRLTCLIILELSKRGVDLEGVNLLDYDMNDPDLSAKLADDFKSEGFTENDFESARSGGKDLTAFDLGVDLPGNEQGNGANCVGDICDQQDINQDGQSNNNSQGNNFGSNGGGSSGDSRTKTLLKVAGISAAAEIASKILGGGVGGGGSDFDVLGVFGKGGFLGKGGELDKGLGSLGVITDALFKDNSPKAITKEELEKSRSKEGPRSGRGPILYGPGVRGGAGIVQEGLGEAGVSTRNFKKNLLGWVRMLTSIAAILSVVALIWGGVLMIVSVGDDSRKDLGKKVIIYALVGLFLMGGAYALVNLFIEGRFA